MIDTKSFHIPPTLREVEFSNLSIIDKFYPFLKGIPQQNNELDDLAKKSIEGSEHCCRTNDE